MKTPEELQSMSLKAAEFLGLEYRKNLNRYYFDIAGSKFTQGKDLYFEAEKLAHFIFDDPASAPILMHLAQVEMEKRGFKWKAKPCPTQREGLIQYSFWNGKDVWASRSDKNKFIAFWDALLTATGESA